MLETGGGNDVVVHLKFTKFLTTIMQTIFWHFESYDKYFSNRMNASLSQKKKTRVSKG